MNQRIQLLRYFLAVAGSGSVRQAAETVNLSQPALTRRIHDLEADLGVELFVRTARGMVLTRFGEVLAHHGREINLGWKMALDEIRDLATGEGGTLRIGAGPAWAFALIPDAVVRLREAFPQVRVEFFDWVSERMQPMLLEGKLDVLVGGIPAEAERNPQLRYEKLLDVEQMVFAGGGHPLQGRVCTPDELRRYPWVWFREAALGRALLREQFDEVGAAWPDSAVDTTSIHFGLRLLQRSGDHLMLLPSTLIRSAAAFGLKALMLQRPLPCYSAGIACREQTLRMRPAAMLREILAEAVGNLPGAAHG